MSCKDCKFCFQLKEIINHEWNYKSVCILLPMTEENDYENFAIVVNKDNGFCEMYTERE